MPVPINKVREEMSEVKANDGNTGNMIPFLDLNPFFSLIHSESSQKDRETIKEIWLTSTSLDNGKLKVASSISQQEISLLRTRGLITGDDGIIEFTETGKKLLREAILDDEESSLVKEASKQLMSKNSYDFGKEVLVKAKHPEKFGTKYIAIDRKAFSENDMIPSPVEPYQIETHKDNGSEKTLKDYGNKELIHVLHLAKKIISNASRLALIENKPIPVHRIKTFAEIVMSELNSEGRS